MGGGNESVKKEKPDKVNI